jgi:hypothetical protein
VAVIGHVCGLSFYVDYAPYVALMAWTLLPLCCSMLASMACMAWNMVWTMRLPKLASMIHLWATVRGISLPVTNSLSSTPTIKT